MKRSRREGNSLKKIAIKYVEKVEKIQDGNVMRKNVWDKNVTDLVVR